MNEDATIAYKDVVVEDRIRKELGEVDALANSIREFGLLQPIILALDSSGRLHLVAGGRRYLALGRIGQTELKHGRDYLLRDELSDGTIEHKLRLQAIELEENIRRKDLTWQEVVLGKQRLLETMQRIHGVADVGGRTKSELLSGESSGFGIRKLASLLGEAVSNVSRDLQIARATKVVPQLLHAQSKESAFRQLSVVSTVATMQGNVAGVPISNGPNGEKTDSTRSWVLYEGDFRDNALKVPDSSVDFICTDLPYGADVDEMSKHATGVADFDDARAGVLEWLDDLCLHTYRVLKDDRFAVFFFGFNYYCELRYGLERAGLKVNPVPFVWFKSLGGTTQDPYHRYANAYEPILVAMKGSPKFLRIGRPNLIQLPGMPPKEKLHINQKPVAIYTNFMFDMTAEGAVCLDWMCGAGTLGVACQQTKRTAIMFEKSPISCQLTLSRMQSAQSVKSPTQPVVQSA